VAGVFSNFCRFFQREGPVIHLLADRMDEVIYLICLNPQHFIKDAKQLRKAVADEKSHLANGLISVGTETSFETAATYLLDHLPVNNEIIQNIRCLNPIIRTEERTVAMVAKLVNLVPQIVPPGPSADIIDDWRLYMVMDIIIINILFVPQYKTKQKS